jgi:hypothetical protein
MAPGRGTRAGLGGQHGQGEQAPSDHQAQRSEHDHGQIRCDEEDRREGGGERCVTVRRQAQRQGTKRGRAEGEAPVAGGEGLPRTVGWPKHARSSKLRQ